MPSGIAYQEQYATEPLGADPRANAIEEAFNTIPAFYTVSIDLAGADGSQQSGSVPLRPEPFLCKRITWATTGDAPKIVGTSNGSGSIQGRSVEVSWQDEFTRFLGSGSCLLSGLFGDSQGYLDFVKPVLFQGKQSLTVNLRRILWPAENATDFPPVTVRFDFNFQGLSVLPLGENQSGSAG
jgi:hypothetical protein